MRKYIFLFALCLAFFLTACGGHEEDITEDAYPYDVETENETIPTLSIFAPEFYRYVINQARRHMSLVGGSNIDLDITIYTPEGREAHLTRLQTMLMAGDAPDMFILDGHPLQAYIQSGFLTDIYQLMDACPLTGRDDFFSQPLAAMEVNGGLYAFPMSFGFNHVLINSSLPPSIINRFSQYESVSINCLMALYTELMRDYGDEFGHLTFSGGASRVGTRPHVMFQSYMGYYVDFENQTSNFADLSFSDFLYKFRSIFEDRWLGDCDFNRFPIAGNPRYLQEQSFKHVFWITNSEARDPAFGLLTTGQTYFLHSIPITDMHGRLKIGPGPGFLDPGDTWGVICIPATNNGPLAWRFSQHLLAAFLIPFSEATYGFNWDHSLASPITRNDFLPRMTYNFEFFIDFTIRNVTEDDRTLMRSQVPAAISRIAELNEMPMSLTYSFLPESLYYDLLDQFMLGVITSDVFAQQLQNRVSLWLIE